MPGIKPGGQPLEGGGDHEREGSTGGADSIRNVFRLAVGLVTQLCSFSENHLAVRLPAPLFYIWVVFQEKKQFA